MQSTCTFLMVKEDNFYRQSQKWSFVVGTVDVENENSLILTFFIYDKEKFL